MSEQAWSILKLRPSSPITFWPFIDFMIVSMVLTSTIPLPSVSNCWNVCQNNPINANYKMWKNVTNHVIWVRFDVFNWSLNAFFIYIPSTSTSLFICWPTIFMCKKIPQILQESWSRKCFIMNQSIIIEFIIIYGTSCHQGWPTCPLGRYSP